MYDILSAIGSIQPTEILGVCLILFIALIVTTYLDDYIYISW